MGLGSFFSGMAEGYSITKGAKDRKRLTDALVENLTGKTDPQSKDEPATPQVDASAESGVVDDAQLAADGGVIGMMHGCRQHEMESRRKEMMEEGMESMMDMPEMTASDRMYSGNEVVNHSGHTDYGKK